MNVAKRRSVKEAYQELAEKVIYEAVKDLKNFKRYKITNHGVVVYSYVLHDQALPFFSSKYFEMWCALAGIDPESVLEKIGDWLV